MNIQPNLAQFKTLAQSGNTLPVYLDLTADCETPLGAYAKISQSKPAFLFESIVGGENISRYSFLGSNPRKIFRIDEAQVHITNKDGTTETVPAPDDPLTFIEEFMAQFQPVELPDMPPFTGGVVGFVGHEYVHSIEPTIPKPSDNQHGLPVLYYMLTDSVLIFDHVRQILRICVHAHIEDDPEAAYAQAVQEIKSIYQQLQQPSPLQHGVLPSTVDSAHPNGNFTQAAFESAVEAVQGYVRSGDVIQTVLSQRFEKDFEPDGIDLYRALRTVNPSPYMFLIQDPEFSIVGASPEVHVRLTGGQVEIRPIAGTRHRGCNEAEDLALEADLLADQKECAEHLMLVDLARNDIGRVCEYASIEVPDYMCIERYSHVMHIVSQVTGTLRADCNAYDLMRATFPAGTLSGAPKVRALQIIAELEQTQRGVYGGALGYFGFGGNHDSCIGIRTAMIKDQKISIQSGAGVVADSIPKSEYDETVNKAKGMLKAVALAERLYASQASQ